MASKQQQQHIPDLRENNKPWRHAYACRVTLSDIGYGRMPPSGCCHPHTSFSDHSPSPSRWLLSCRRVWGMVAERSFYVAVSIPSVNKFFEVFSIYCHGWSTPCTRRCFLHFSFFSDLCLMNQVHCVLHPGLSSTHVGHNTFHFYFERASWSLKVSNPAIRSPSNPRPPGAVSWDASH